MAVRRGRAFSPREAKILKKNVIPFENEWEQAFGTPEMNDTWFITGKSASGKSSFVMQLAKELCKYGMVLYVSVEEGLRASFCTRMERFKMTEVQGKFRIIEDSDIEALKERLKKPKSGKFVIVDSFNMAGWSYEQAEDLISSFPHKSFIFIAQEYKGEPMGKPAARLKYLAGIKVRTIGYRAYCQGRYAGDTALYYTIWAEGAAKVWNETGNKI